MISERKSDDSARSIKLFFLVARFSASPTAVAPCQANC